MSPELRLSFDRGQNLGKKPKILLGECLKSGQGKAYPKHSREGAQHWKKREGKQSSAHGITLHCFKITFKKKKKKTSPSLHPPQIEKPTPK